MSSTSWKYYSGLASKIYPKTFAETQKKGRSVGEVWIDTQKTWGRLPEFSKREIIEELEKELKSGKRKYRDYNRDNRIIKGGL